MRNKKYIFISILIIAILSFVGYSIAENNRSGIISSGNNSDINVIQTIDPMLDIAEGKVDGYAALNKFGRNVEIDNNVTADIWDGGYTVGSGGESLIWVAPTQARLHDIVSDNAADNAAGTGTHSLEIFGLLNWVSGEVNEVVIPDGTSTVSTSLAYVIINRMKVLTKGSGSSNVGLITATAATDGTVSSQIQPNMGQTQQTIYGLPSSQNLYLRSLYANVNKSGGQTALIDFALLCNPEPQTELTNFNTVHPSGLMTVGTSALPIPFLVPKKITGPMLMKIQVRSGTDNMDVSAGFDGILVDTNTDYLLGGGSVNGIILADRFGRYLLHDGS